VPHRDQLIGQIRSYASQNPGEVDVTQRFLEFVQGYPDCFERTQSYGHITGSAFIVDPSGDRTLLTHHRKLDIWVQLGGHSDGDPHTLNVALREAEEESQLGDFEPVSEQIFDLDIHKIPARGDEPEHFHFDVRFAFFHRGDGNYTVTEESHDLAWVDLNDVSRFTTEPDMTRMVTKWKNRV